MTHTLQLPLVTSLNSCIAFDHASLKWLPGFGANDRHDQQISQEQPLSKLQTAKHCADAHLITETSRHSMVTWHDSCSCMARSHSLVMLLSTEVVGRSLVNAAVHVDEKHVLAIALPDQGGTVPAKLVKLLPSCCIRLGWHQAVPTKSHSRYCQRI